MRVPPACSHIPVGDAQKGMFGSGSSAVVLMGRKYEKNGNDIPEGKNRDILQSAPISHRESAVPRGERHLRCDECQPRIRLSLSLAGSST